MWANLSTLDHSRNLFRQLPALKITIAYFIIAVPHDISNSLMFKPFWHAYRCKVHSKVACCGNFLLVKLSYFTFLMKLFRLTLPPLLPKIVFDFAAKPFVLIEVTLLVCYCKDTKSLKSCKNTYVYFTIALLITECHLIIATDAQCRSQKIDASFPVVFSIASANSRCVSPLCSGVNTYQI